ncbi:MAG: hypothetical protein A3F54_02800 [Candidatus Kerfeldbacteria bacterium RIFCSPHIGHO2_12_FULL_48_17]|uniref:DUF4325 domain-containing protein n=1 Tax=Candidatus Kerfeldbacteria bacterium RIFCSPHIGHO2_12_FULL_48_17 TaxID=1798542 RepID=A0A1G2B2R1_9BACT|nr:MAG: hypothetical protein A3F54_02800 [Candidatus Kerfeldbacteria bacterium RIFCSPHIGHO2_12_FULL_48_17]
MNIFIKKFGTTLVSRQTGKEAFAALHGRIQGLKPGEDIILDFRGVITLSPGWADEFLTPLWQKYGQRILLQKTSNASVETTIKFLEGIHKMSFRRV